MSTGVFRRRWVPPLRRAFPWTLGSGAALDAAGAVTLAGSAALATTAALSSSGPVTVTGSATLRLTAVLSASGQVTVAGTAILPAALSASGSVTFGCSAGLTIAPLDHWASVREGDIVKLVLPHASFVGRTVLARVLARQLTDGSPHMEIEVQVIEQVDAQTALRAFGDLGAAGAPPVVIPVDARVTQGYPVIRAQIEELQRLVALQALKYP